MRNQIKQRLKEFQNLSEEKIYQEFLFCLLTPQSQAQRCWSAVLELSNLSEFTQSSVSKILKSKTRFHNTKTKRILQAPKTFEKIKPLLQNQKDIKSLRNSISKEVNGYGLKESSHFLRNIGFSNNKIAILDRHILKNLHSQKLIPEPKIKSQKNYLEIEEIFLDYAKSLKIPADELDLILWSKENGEIFK
jgi:N-glycosylase/DNA lyase